jgi:hypothetical protein
MLACWRRDSSSTRCCSLSNAAWHAARSPTSSVGRGGAARLQTATFLFRWELKLPYRDTAE